MGNAAWHSSKSLEIPSHIEWLFIPPYPPEMNPIEQLWKELRKDFTNKLFASLQAVMHPLQTSVNNLTNELVESVTSRSWILKIF